MDYPLHRAEDCTRCFQDGRVAPKCDLCETDYNYGQEVGMNVVTGRGWCSEECRWWSDILVRNMTDQLVIVSDEKWIAFYRAQYGYDLPESEIPNPRDFYPVLTDHKYIGKTSKRSVSTLPRHLYGYKTTEKERTHQAEGKAVGAVQADYPQTIPARGWNVAVLHKRCGTGRSGKGSNRAFHSKLPLLHGVAV